MMAPPKSFQESDLYRRLRAAKHGVILVLGTGQWGKTVTVHSLIASGVFGDRNIALVNYPTDFVESHAYPKNYRSVSWPEDLDAGKSGTSENDDYFQPSRTFFYPHNPEYQHAGHFDVSESRRVHDP